MVDVDAMMMVAVVAAPPHNRLRTSTDTFQEKNP